MISLLKTNFFLRLSLNKIFWVLCKKKKKNEKFEQETKWQDSNKCRYKIVKSQK